MSKYRTHSTLNAMDHWYNAQSTASGHCRGWESEANRERQHLMRIGPQPRPPPRQPTGLEATEWSSAKLRAAEYRWAVHCDPEMTEEQKEALRLRLLELYPGGDP